MPATAAESIRYRYPSTLYYHNKTFHLWLARYYSDTHKQILIFRRNDTEKVSLQQSIFIFPPQITNASVGYYLVITTF